MKGVILAGGFGTRLRPFTLRFNKGMAPIYCPNGAIPQLIFPLTTLINSGVTEILIVTSRDHCGSIVEVLGDGTDYKCNLTYKIQEMERSVVGIAQALGLAKDFVGNNNFAVILGDNYYEDTFQQEFISFDMQPPWSLKRENERYRLAPAGIFLKTVEDPQRFGVATLNNKGRVTRIVEKPKNPETNYAVTGLYLYTPQVFDLLPHLKPSHRNELEITDINNRYVDDETMKAYILKGHWSDMGLPESAKHVSDFLYEKAAKEKLDAKV